MPIGTTAAVASHSKKQLKKSHSSSFLLRSKHREGSNQNLKTNRVRDAKDKDKAAAEVLQEAIRSKIIAKQHLHRSNLAERLLFESSVLWETARFINQVLVFALLLVALRLSSDEVQKRGIFENLKDSFDFEALQDVNTRQGFVEEGLPLINMASKDYFLLSSNYFDANGAGSKQLIRDMVSFSAPVSAGQLTLSGSQFSFTVWVKTGPEFIKGYILQKPSGAGLSCWGWHLHGRSGPELHYGGHDFYPASPKYPAQLSEQQRQIHVGPAGPAGLPSGTEVMLTVSVSEHDVTFYYNTDKVHSAKLPVPLSDCFNDGQGILVGDAGLELGDLRYHPTALSQSTIEELFFDGGALGDLASGSQPERVIYSEVEALDGSISASLSEMEARQGGRQISTDINFVIDRTAQSTAWHSPIAPTGTTQASNSSVLDAALGRQYYSLFMGPARLTETKADDEHRYIEGAPSFEGTGMTLSFWFRPRKCSDPQDTCGLFLFGAYEGDSLNNTQCWTLWLEKSKLWWDNPKATDGNKAQYPPFGIAESYNLVLETAWRHLAMVFNEESDKIQFYMDGAFVVEETWGSDVKTTGSCTSDDFKISFGHLDPGYTYGGVVEVYDVRSYVHEAGRGPLDAAEIRNISGRQTPGLDDEFKCIDQTDEAFEEQEWRDAYGHGCTWYGDNAAEFPALCNFPEAGQMCPISCSSRQECLTDAEPHNAYYSWRGIRRIEPGLESPMGALCKSDGMSREQIVEQCKTWVANGIPDAFLKEHWYESFKQNKTAPSTEDRNGNRLDLRDCDVVAAAIKEDCALNATAVKAFTKESQANNGDFTFTFWLAPVGEASMVEEADAFIPHIQFLSTISPPQHNLALGLWANPNGEARIFSACPASEDEKRDNVEFRVAAREGWTFFAISRKNREEGSDKKGEMATLTNVGKRWEGSAWEGKQCLFDPEAFFTALEVNYPVLMSPITMIPAYVPIASLQRTFNDLVGEMKFKFGPSFGSANNGGIPIDKQTFSQPMILVAPPVIFQTRGQPAESCPSKFGNEIIETHHSQMLQSQCSVPFVCEEELRASAAKLLACAGDDEREAVQFGLFPSDFDGERGYADFLASVTEPVLVKRMGSLFRKEDFMDALTNTAQVLLIFWNPEASTTTVMSVTADFVHSSAADVSVSVEHYELLEGSKLDTFVVVQILVLVNVVLMVLDIFYNLKTKVQDVIELRKQEAEEEAEVKRERDRHRSEMARASGHAFEGQADSGLQRSASTAGTAVMNLFGPEAIFGIIRDVLKSVGELLRDLVDAVIALLVVVYVARRIPTKQESASKTKDTVGALSEIEWGNTQLPRDTKVEMFFEAMNELTDMINSEGYLNQFCNFVLLLSLLRLIKCTGMHPRLALLEGTLSKAWDDLWHAMILIVLLLLCFAGVGTWRFGTFRGDFADIETSCQTLFMMTFGEFPDDWAETRDLQLFTVLFFVLVFLLVQNFLLAVIVEAYMGVRKDNEDLETEQEFVLDIYSSFHAHWLAYRKGWPTPHKLGQEIEVWEARKSVAFNDLWNTGWFKSKTAVVDFLRHYKGYDFLDPVPFDEYGPEIKNEQEKLAKDLELRLGKTMGLKIQTLKEYAEEQLSIARERRIQREGRRAMLGDGAGSHTSNASSQQKSSYRHSAPAKTLSPPVAPAAPAAQRGTASASPLTKPLPTLEPVASLGHLDDAEAAEVAEKAERTASEIDRTSKLLGSQQLAAPQELASSQLQDLQASSQQQAFNGSGFGGSGEAVRGATSLLAEAPVESEDNFSKALSFTTARNSNDQGGTAFATPGNDSPGPGTWTGNQGSPPPAHFRPVPVPPPESTHDITVGDADLAWVHHGSGAAAANGSDPQPPPTGQDTLEANTRWFFEGLGGSSANPSG